MKTFRDRLMRLEGRRLSRGLPSERRKALTDRAVLHDDAEALAELEQYRPDNLQSATAEQRTAALAAGLRADT